MNTNDILRRVRYMFDFNDETMLSIFKLGGYHATKPELLSWLARDEAPEFAVCADENLARFLNGLIIKNRGPKGDEVPEPERKLTNNIVLRKLKIALNLQADDLLEMLKLNDFNLGQHELSALFRRPDHKNYRECLDQLLRNFLDGMEKHYRKK
ncbi:MAG: DUF1456 family protein [Thalassolituus oleivorans]|nr:DUF1456 family protein [Thalassolituus oleivorans]MBQ0726988.1 DUF1456 family protein [Thalassolituus oleivorans]